MKKNKTLSKFNIYFSILCCFLIFSSAIILTNFNFIINKNTFSFIHIMIETVFIVIGVIALLLVNNPYSYNRNLKYIIPGDLFLCVSLFTLLHIYYLTSNNINVHLFSYSNLVIASIALIIFFSLIIPDKECKINKFAILLLPLTISALCIMFVFHCKNISAYYYNYVSITCQQLIYFVIIDIILSISLIISLIKSKHDLNNCYVSLSCMLFLISSLLSINSADFYDLYDLLSHVSKLLGLICLCSFYYISSLKSTFLKLENSMNEAILSNNIKTDFMINLSHELKTPINILLCSFHCIENSDINKVYYDSMYNNVLRLNRLSENIIAFNNIENGDGEKTLSNIDITYMIDDILCDADEAADRKNVEIEFEHTGKTMIKSDYKKLKIIFLNLISNALKYAPNGGCVKININSGNNIDALIINDGPKIPNSEKNKVFKKFYKCKDNKLDSTEGLGIGLYIARKYTELLNGTVEIIDVNKYEGYKLSIPVLESDSFENGKIAYNVEGFFSDIN